MDTDLLVNPKIAGTVDLETVDIPTLSFNDMPTSEAPAAPPAPRLVPTLDETGPVQIGGFENLNAEAFAPAPSRTVRMSEDVVQKE